MASKKKEKPQEQASHKVIEKRRRDRINNCLAELSQTVPAAFAKQTSGKLEKAEILEMTVEYLRAIQATEIGMRFENGEWFSSDIWADFVHHYQSGYSECMREVVRYMTDVEGIDVNDSRCVRILSYLQSRFRPEASVNAGNVHREALQRVLTGNKGVEGGAPSSHHSHYLRSVHRYSPYAPPTASASFDESHSREKTLTSTALTMLAPTNSLHCRPLAPVARPTPPNPFMSLGLPTGLSGFSGPGGFPREIDTSSSLSDRSILHRPSNGLR